MTADFQVHSVQRPGRQIGTVQRPVTIEAALRALAGDPSARPLAGGTDLLLDLQRGGPGPAQNVVDLSAIDGFTVIEEEGKRFRLAGGVRHNQVVQHDGLIEFALPLAQACLEVGSPQLRNRATIAGNLVTASPANDTISALMALGASVEVSRASGGEIETREVAVDDFFGGFRQTVLRAGELITAILVPKLAPNERGIWVKLGLRRAQAISVVHAGMVLSFAAESTDGDFSEREITAARLALGSVAPTVVIIEAFASSLVGNRLTGDAIAEAARSASTAVAPISDGRATAEYRVDGIEVTVRRALRAIATGQHDVMWPDNPPTLSTSEELSTPADASEQKILPTTDISVGINGVTYSAPVGSLTLLDWVRDEAGLTGMKEGCAEGECGACTMILNGSAVMSCLVAAAQADGAKVKTVDGLAHPIQGAFVDEFAVQCGFCIPGFLMAGSRLLEENDSPTNEQINLGFSGNLCRCAGYYPIVEAVHAAADKIRAGDD